MSEHESRVDVETLANPHAYSPRQIDLMCLIASALDRGKLVIVEPPEERA